MSLHTHLTSPVSTRTIVTLYHSYGGLFSIHNIYLYGIQWLAFPTGYYNHESRYTPSSSLAISGQIWDELFICIRIFHSNYLSYGTHGVMYCKCNSWVHGIKSLFFTSLYLCLPIYSLSFTGWKNMKRKPLKVRQNLSAYLVHLHTCVYARQFLHSNKVY